MTQKDEEGKLFLCENIFQVVKYYTRSSIFLWINYDFNFVDISQSITPWQRYCVNIF